MEGKDKAMPLVACEEIPSPEAPGLADIDRLHGLGWTDIDSIDAIFHGAGMVRHGIMFKAFRMDCN